MYYATRTPRQPVPLSEIPARVLDPLPTVIPSDLCALILSKGPTLLGRLTIENGGVEATARLMGITSLTLTRWIYGVNDHRTNRTRGKGTWTGAWAGYPSPFPGLDLAAKTLSGQDCSYLELLVKRHGSRLAWTKLTLESGFSLMDLGFDPRFVHKALKELPQVPRPTRRRWLTRVHYPETLKALDRVCLVHTGAPWLATVMDSNARGFSRTTPRSALLVLCRYAGITPMSIPRRTNP